MNSLITQPGIGLYSEGANLHQTWLFFDGFSLFVPCDKVMARTACADRGYHLIRANFFKKGL